MSDASLAPDANIAEAAAFLRGRGFDGRFDCAMVLGTGLGNLADDLEDPVSVAYAETPHFPLTAVSGHPGRLIAGKIERKRVLLLQGRAHYYETGDAAAMKVPLGVIAALGGPPLLLTNAAGSIKLDLRPSSLVAITDHINLSGSNPLFRDRSDARLVNLTGAYDERLRKKLKLAATAAGISLHEGVYMWFSGPSFETPAEIRMAKTLGADLVGMSTVPEVILARYFGLKVAALSVVTNMAAGIAGAAPSHAETKQKAAGAGAGLRRLIRAFVSRIDDV
jgi:purine-nucleoside phosphorylase